MDDLISRQAAIDRAVSIPMFGRDVKMVSVSEIKNLPPAQPEVLAHGEGELSAQPEIIRCKECIYFDKYIDCIEMYQWDGFCADWARKTYENWYCSRAERKDNG